MADFEKVYQIKFETRRAQAALQRLDTGLLGIEKKTLVVGKSFEHSVGRVSARSVDKLNTRLKATRLNLSQLKSGLDTVARRAAMAAAAFVAVGGVSVRNVIKLNEGLANVGTLLNGGVNAANRFRKGIQEMAVSTGKSTEDLTEGLYQVVSALQESSENMGQLEMSAKAAVAGRSSTLGAINMLAAVTKGYGDTSAKAMEHTSDLAFMTVKLGQTTFPELAASIGRVVPLAAALNTRQEELFGSMATLTGVTGDTAEVSTQLASVYAAMLKPTESMEKTVSKLGFSSAAAMMKELGFAGSLRVLNKAVDGDTEALAQLFRRKEAMIAVMALLGGQSDTYTQKLAAMENVIGATDQAYRVQTEGINKQGHEWERTKQRMVVFSQRVGEKLLPVLGKLMDRLEPVFHYLENINDEAIESAIQFGKWLIIIAATTKAFSGLLGVVQLMGTLAPLTGGLNAAAGGMGALATSAGIAAKAVWGLQAAGLALAAVGLAKMVQDVIIEPDNAATRNRHAREEDLTFQAEQAAKRGDLTQQKSALKNLEAEYGKQYKKAVWGGQEIMVPREGYSVEENAQAAMGVDIGAQYRSRKNAAEKAMRVIRGNIQISQAAEFEQEWGLSPIQSRMPSVGGQSQGVTYNNPINLTVNTAATDAAGTARAVRRELDRRDKKIKENLRRATRGAAAVEQ